jgi:hypothetical protein
MKQGQKQAYELYREKAEALLTEGELQDHEIHELDEIRIGIENGKPDSINSVFRRTFNDDISNLAEQALILMEDPTVSEIAKDIVQQLEETLGTNTVTSLENDAFRIAIHALKSLEKEEGE